MRIRSCLIPLLTCCAASGQFSSLTTTGDGSVVYFATPLRQKNTTQPDYGKLFRAAPRVTLQESRELVPPKPVPSGILGVGKYELSNTYNLVGVSVSSDGATIAAAGTRTCIGDTVYCSKREDYYQTTVSSAGRSQELPGNLRLSANGKWAFGNSSLLPVYSSRGGYRIDLTSGAQTTVSGTQFYSGLRVASAGRPIANDGTAVFGDGSILYLVRGEPSQRLTLENRDQPVEAVIDAAARVVVYSVVHNTGSGSTVILSGEVKSLHTVPVEGGDPRLLDAAGYSPSISDDGARVSYLRRVDGVAQAWIIDIDGSSPRQLTSEPAGIASATLSGDGNTAYAVTLGGRIIRISTRNGDVSETVARTPWMTPDQSTAPGRFTVLTGLGFAASDATQVTVQDKPAPVVAIEPEAISILVPPDVGTTLTSSSSAKVAMSAAPESPFEGPRVSIQIAESAPIVLFVRPGRQATGVLAAHEDWSGLVTEASPARPGEVIHVYAAGLGATAPAVPFGEPAPSAEPLARLLANYTCTDSSNTNRTVDVLYQGLAPGMTGIYQVDFRLPDVLTPPSFGLYCRLDPTANFGPAFGGRIPVKQ